MKKGQSQIITTVLIILLVLAAIVIIWTVIYNVISDKGEDISPDPFIVRLEASPPIGIGNCVEIGVKRKAGGGTMTGIRFIFKNDTIAKSYIERNESLFPKELETKIFTFCYPEDINVSNITKVSFLPLFSSGRVGIPTPELEVIPAPPLPQYLLTGLVSWWEFKDGSGTILSDSVGNNDGDIFDSEWVIDSERGSVLDFSKDGITDYVIINPINNFPSEEITVSYWMLSLTNASDQIGDFSYGYSPISYAVPVFDNEFNPFYEQGFYKMHITDTELLTPIYPELGIWQHHTIAWNSMNGSLHKYINGELVFNGTVAKNNSITNGGSLVFAQDQDSVGGGFATHQDLEGYLDEIMIYNRRLNSSEVKDIYNSQK
jgi:hypothetical protein